MTEESCMQGECLGVEYKCSCTGVYICGCLAKSSQHFDHKLEKLPHNLIIRALNKIQKESKDLQESIQERAQVYINFIKEICADKLDNLNSVQIECERIRTSLSENETRLSCLLDKFEGLKPGQVYDKTARVVKFRSDKFDLLEKLKLKVMIHGIKNNYRKVVSKSNQVSGFLNQIGTEGKPMSLLIAQGSFLGVDSARVLSLALPYSKLTELHLGANGIGDEGAESIAQALPKCKLSKLNLWLNEISDKGAKALGKALPGSSLTMLILSSNSLSAKGAKALGKALPSSELRSLYLYNNSLGSEGAQRVAEFLPNSKLIYLDLGQNSIGDLGAIAIAGALCDSEISYLLLENNQIADAGAQAIAKAIPSSQLIMLRLRKNSIQKGGAEAIVRTIPDSKLTELYLWDAKIGGLGLDRIANTLPNSHLNTLGLDSVLTNKSKTLWNFTVVRLVLSSVKKLF